MKQYRFRDGEFQELEHTMENLNVPPKRTYVVCWNEMGGCWDFGMSTGTRIEKIWDKEHLPPALRTHLLILGVTL